MRSSNLLLFLFSAVVFAKEEIDCDEIEILKMLSEGCARHSNSFLNRLSGKDLPKLERIKQEKSEAVCKAKHNAKKRISQHAGKVFLYALTRELTKFNRNFNVREFIYFVVILKKL
jgi:hypothetical protein